MARAVSNNDIADMLNQIADLLEAKEENIFRVRSYRNAATTVAGVRQSLATLITEKGPEGLSGLKGIGEKLAGLIREYVEKGDVELLKELQKTTSDAVLPDRPHKPQHSFPQPIDVPVQLVLDVDREYRARAAAGTLKMVAPRLLNPEKKPWLPVMTMKQEGYEFTVMFSNTATAHKLERTNDWVVVYVKKGKGENQWTVVTETRGPLKGKRVIRGREKECAAIS
jgi:hypothetical protein